MINSAHVLAIFTLIIIIIISSPNYASSQCPMDLNYVLTLPWDSSSCHNINSSSSSSCCQTLTSLYGVAFAQRLKQTSLFRLPDLQTSLSCLVDFQSKLTRLNLPHHLTSLCFQPLKFVNTTNVCANIQTKNDWLSILGHTTPLDKACKKDVYDLSACNECVVAGFRVQALLRGHDHSNNNSKGCFYYTILYAAGVVHELGPDSEGALSCIFGLPLIKAATSVKKIALICSSIGGVVVVACFVGVWMRCWCSKKAAGSWEFDDEAEDNRLLNWRPRGDSLWFDIRQLEEATNAFSSMNLIAKGQFGVVYKGRLADGRMIAVKVITECDEFIREVEMMSNLKHRNLVPLRGCCVTETQQYLVYDYMMNGNLSDHLFKKGGGHVSWAQRKKIILDVANGLAYLHYGVNPPIYHRDIKPTNILLDSYMRARVGDFGLAKQGGSHPMTRVAGTHGYLAPEYALYGQLTEKSDVYSFGILVLEIMSGRKAIELGSPTFLITDWAWLLVKGGSTERVLDPDHLLGCEDDFCLMVMERFVKVGILCAHLMVALRPTILDAIKMLQGDIEVPTIPDRPFYAHFQLATTSTCT